MAFLLSNIVLMYYYFYYIDMILCRKYKLKLNFRIQWYTILT